MSETAFRVKILIEAEVLVNMDKAKSPIAVCHIIEEGFKLQHPQINNSDITITSIKTGQIEKVEIW